MVYIQKIIITPIDIKSFFPTNDILDGQSSIIQKEQRLLFTSSENKGIFKELHGLDIIEDIFEIPNNTQTSMIIFPQLKQPELLDKLASEKILGPPVIGQILSKEFISDIRHYVFLILPILFFLFVLLTSLRYLFSILIEILSVSFLLLFTVSLLPYDINISFLLSLVFAYIYAFTILNYFYYGDIQKMNLLKGIIISLLTTALSAFFLSKSDFLVISDFGKSLLIWLSILGFYLGLRLYYIQAKNWNLLWLNYFLDHVRIEKYILWTVSIIILLTFVLHHKLIINLNPISISNSSSMIDDFEEEYILAQPVLLSIKSHSCTFKEVACAQELSVLIDNFINEVPMKAERIIDFNMMYQSFTESNMIHIDKKKLAQFYLALEFYFNPKYLISTDGQETLILFSISIKESTDTLLALEDKIDDFNIRYPHFTLESLSHIGKIKKYKQMFVEETVKGIFIVFSFIVILFISYYRNIFILIIFIPAIITILLFFAIHSIFMISISLMSLVALILFIGLIADNLIHIFICYKHHTVNCMSTVYKPIILSNILMILSLLGMVFSGTLLQKFGLELGFLLIMHLFLLVYFLPRLLSGFITVKETKS